MVLEWIVFAKVGKYRISPLREEKVHISGKKKNILLAQFGQC